MYISSRGDNKRDEEQKSKRQKLDGQRVAQCKRKAKSKYSEAN